MLVQRYLLASFGSLSVRGTDVWTLGLRLSLGWAAFSVSSLALAHYCRINTRRLRKKIKTDPSTIGPKDQAQWNSWAWLVLNYVVAFWRSPPSSRHR